ncbi:MAG: DUF4330 family protein [Candidatus Omnitrophota bacterium]
MKLIDEKGRVFGKINIIDFLALLFLFCLLPMFYFGYRIMKSGARQDVVEVKKEYVDVVVQCLFAKLKEEDIGIISSWKGEQGADGQADVRIINLGEPQPYKYEFDVGNGKKLIKEDKALKQVDAFLRLNSEIRGSGLFYNGKALRVGEVLTFDIAGQRFECRVMEVYPDLKRQQIIIRGKIQTVDVYVTLKDLSDAVLDAIAVGDKEVRGEGEVVAEVLALGKVANNVLDVDLGAGSFVRAEEAGKKQISARMRLRVKKTDSGLFYFKDKRMMRGQPLKFDMGRYKVWGVLSNTFEVVSRLNEHRVSLQVKFTGLAPEVAKVIQRGDVEKDAQDKVVARIGEVISNKPSQVLTIKEGQFISLNHPFQRDIVLGLDVLCIEKDGVYYFKNYPVKMGNNIVFATELYSISGMIVGMDAR